LETDLPSFETMICLDPLHLTRVLMNLVLNARDAMPHGGKLNISVSWVLGSDIVSPSARVRRDKRYVCIKVADNGVGISPAALKRIFDPFYTTKRAEQGTGLGLAIVQSILRRSRGCVTVESKESQGTIFRCYLPGKLKDRSAKKCEPASERAV
jgi:two-component system, cell cycle sensor histidine kinase and response regulator CckA